MFISTALLAYLLDFIFAEFEKIRFFKHPIIIIGDYISWFERLFYKDSILRGSYLSISLLILVLIITYLLSLIDNIFIQGFFCSFCLSHNMLYSSVKNIITINKIEEKKEKISQLVSRDTENMTDSDINKSAIETYSENLSDGVIAPLFYLCLFGIMGAFLYKAINTLDSMVGYRTQKYEKFGKFSAKLDDIINFIPSRITAVLITVLFKNKFAFFNFYKYGSKHESLNAGFPIAAMALSIDVKLGGNTSYFGKIKKKPYFGVGKILISRDDVIKALSIKNKIDILIFLGLGIGVLL